MWCGVERRLVPVFVVADADGAVLSGWWWMLLVAA
jgi:hypothetical protein